MNRTLSLAVLALIALLATPMAAQAGWLCPEKDKDFRPYLEHNLHPQHAAHRFHDWQLADWAPDRGTGLAQMDAFFRAGVLTDYVDGRKPTLVVGQGFYHLSNYDQRRVVALFDHLYNVTAEKPGVLRLKDWHTGKTIGLYGASGLQLQ